MARFNPTKAYLEQARSYLESETSLPTSSADDVEPPNLIFAQIANAYIFSYMALTAFVNVQINHLWNEPDRPLQTQYPKAKSVKHLLNSDLKELKEGLKALCRHCSIPQIHEEHPQVWNDLNQVVKVVRDYLVHPHPDPDAFHDVVVKAGHQRAWNFAPRVAESVISHFYVTTRREIPPWVRANQEFVVDRVQALRVASEDEL